LAVHAADCPVAKKLQHKDGERFMGVEWSDEIVRAFETDLALTVIDGRGVMAKVASVLAAAEADIVHIEMGEANSHDAKDMHFVIAVRDRAHLESILTKLQRSTVVMHAKRSKKTG
jgi:GTP pyrophosphokinase